MVKDLPKLYEERRSPEEVRKHLAEQKDLKENRRRSEDIAHRAEPETGPAGEQKVALNTIQIMGQLLKNYPFALEKETKRDLIEQSCLLGLRALKDTFNGVEQMLGVLMENFVSKRITNYDEGRKAEDIIALEKDFKRFSFLLAEIVARSYLSRTSEFIFSKDLQETYKVIIQRNRTTAFDLLQATFLFKQSVSHSDWNSIFLLYDNLQKNNPLSAEVLRRLAYHNLQLFPSNRRTLQMVCDRINISSYQKLKLHQATVSGDSSTLPST